MAEEIKTGWSALKWGLVILVVLGILGGAASCVATIGTVATTPGEIIRKTLDSTNVIQNYEWFKQQYRDILANEVQLRNADAALDNFKASAGDRSTWKFEDRTEFNRLSMVALALQNSRASMIAEYNAKANMQNRSIFMGSDVPAEIAQ